jgi:serine/threonine-protein kinase RsbW
MAPAVLDSSVAILEVRADAADIRLASNWLDQQGRARAIPHEQIFRLDLCLNEALANVIEHGGREAVLAPVRLSLGADVDDNGGHARLMVSDVGRAFNPLAIAPKVLADSLATATPGGMGLVLMSNFADELAYEYRHGHNCLLFAVHWSTGGLSLVSETDKSCGDRNHRRPGSPPHDAL